MKKAIVIFLAIVIAATLIGVAAYQFRATKASKTLVPADATMLLQINVDALFKTLAWNAISHPAYYLSSDSKKKKRKDQELRSDIALPATIFAYGLPEFGNNTLFTRLKVKDPVALLKKLGLKIKSTGVSEVGQAQTTDQRISACFKDDILVASFSTGKQNTFTKLEELLKEHNFVQAKTLKIYSKNDNHLIFTSADITAKLNFENGEIVGEVTTKTNTLKLPSVLTKPIPNDSCVGYLYWNGKLDLPQNKVWAYDSFQVETDSLLANLGQSLCLVWMGSITQQQNIVSYEFNEDFEKTAVTKSVTKIVPKLDLTLTTKANGMLNYLRFAKMISVDSINAAAFPLFKAKVFQTEDTLFVYTSSNPRLNTAKETTNRFFGCKLDFIKAKNAFSIWPAELNNLSAFEASGIQQDNQFVFSFTLSLRQPKINAIVQIFK